jgi:hypothetical protein
MWRHGGQQAERISLFLSAGNFFLQIFMFRQQIKTSVETAGNAHNKSSLLIGHFATCSLLCLACCKEGLKYFLGFFQMMAITVDTLLKGFLKTAFLCLNKIKNRKCKRKF